MRDTALLEPEMTVEHVDAFVLSCGSAFGAFDAARRCMPTSRESIAASCPAGCGYRSVPGASLFDLVNGGDKASGRKPPSRDMGFRAAEAAGDHFALGTAGAGYGANPLNSRAASDRRAPRRRRGCRFVALVAADPAGRVTRGNTRHFLAAPFERDGEFGGHGFGAENPEDALNLRLRRGPPDQHHARGGGDRREAREGPGRAACGMAQAGFALAFRPALSSVDGDIVFATATGRSLRMRPRSSGPRRNRHAGRRMRRPVDSARPCEATSLPFPGALPSWRHGSAATGHGGPSPSLLLRRLPGKDGARSVLVSVASLRGEQIEQEQRWHMCLARASSRFCPSMLRTVPAHAEVRAGHEGRHQRNVARLELPARCAARTWRESISNALGPSAIVLHPAGFAQQIGAASRQAAREFEQSPNRAPQCFKRRGIAALERVRNLGFVR